MNKYDPETVILEERESLAYNQKDDKLVSAINKAVSKSKTLKMANDEESEKREEYWKRGALKSTLAKIHPKKAKTINNRIWANILTILPYWVNRTPHPSPIAEDLENKDINNIVKALQIAWEVNDNMKWKFQQAILHWLIYHIGVLKLRRNEEKKGIETIVVLPKKIGFDPKATKKENCDYMWEIMEDSAEELIEKYPSKKKQITKAVGGKDNLKTKVNYLEFWGGGGKWVAWKLDNIILHKEKNPNFDYKNPENGVLKTPTFPYLLLNCFNLGTSLYDDTGIIDQAISLQDSANKLERQILDLNEGQKRTWVASGEAISKESFQKIINETGDFGAYLDRRIPEGGLHLVMSGKPDASLFNDLTHILNEEDNVMGVHAASRGQYQPGMAGIGMKGYGMMIQQDLAKDLIVSRIEQLAEDWFNLYLHMIKVFSSDNIKFVGPGDSVSLSKENIPLGIKIMVKKNSMLPIDRESRAKMALELAKMQIAAPADIYNDLGYGDTTKRLIHLQEFQQGQVVPSDETPEGKNLAKLQKLLNSPEFQQLPDAQKAEALKQARQITEAIKARSAQSQPIQPTQGQPQNNAKAV